MDIIKLVKKNAIVKLNNKFVKKDIEKYIY